MNLDAYFAQLSQFFRATLHAAWGLPPDPSGEGEPGSAGASGPAAAPGAELGQFAWLTRADAPTPLSASSADLVSTIHAAAPAPTIVGLAGRLRFNLIWDASVAAAPAAFRSAIIAAAKFYTTMFSNDETINVHVGYGEVDGSALGTGDLGSSINNEKTINYTTVLTDLKKDAAWSPRQGTADATLPTTNPTGTGVFALAYSQAKAFGLIGANSTVTDGWIGLASPADSVAFDYSRSTPIGTSQYDAIGTAEHELSEVMGRVGDLGSLDGAHVYSPLDLFRYYKGARALAAGPGYFSIDGGKTNIANYNNPNNGGDAADWIPSLKGDAYGDGYNGVFSPVSSTDLVEVSMLGYHLTAAGLTATKTLGLA